MAEHKDITSMYHKPEEGQGTYPPYFTIHRKTHRLLWVASHNKIEFRLDYKWISAPNQRHSLQLDVY